MNFLVETFSAGESGPVFNLGIGNVACFEPVKNHEFLLSLAKELKSAGLRFKIVLVGDGVKRQEIETKVNEEGLSDCFIFAGLRKNVNEFYQAFDLSVMPSIFEGIPFSVIEAETAGLPCVLSKGIPSDVDFSENVVHASINNVVEWKNTLIKLMAKKSIGMMGKHN